MSGSAKGSERRMRRRKIKSIVGWILVGTAFALLAAALLSILLFVIVRGGAAIRPSLFVQDTTGLAGGLRNAIVGTLLISGGALVIAVPVGVLTGVYLSERRSHRMTPIVRFCSDILTGVPSIVLGYFGYIALVIGFGWHFSLAAGSLTLSIMLLPYIARTSELALEKVPAALREAAYALGASERKVVFAVLLRAALPGVITGILIAFALGLGETAPLLYTAGWSNYTWHGHVIHEPIGYLTYVIWSFIGEPFASAHQLAYAAALLVTLLVFVIAVITRVVVGRGNLRVIGQ